ncbi:MAG TPA: FAD binding domain-containing protein, partial [Rubrobacter sp.]|nr:FAD binding domain-containing protein [Rubrobacter sp.]
KVEAVTVGVLKNFVGGQRRGRLHPGLRVVVMGGSLGGLTTALILRDIGCDVEVYERSEAPLEGRGAGIVLHPATVRYFIENDALDIGEISTSTRWVRYMDRYGSTAAEHPFSYRFTSYNALYRGLLGCFDENRYRLGEEVVGFDQDAGGVTVRLASARRERCHLLVCADGIHSTGRRLLLPNVTPVYAGYVGWRGTVEEADLTPETFAALREAITYYVLPNSHTLVYPIPGTDGSLKPGRRFYNWLWYRNVAEGPELNSLMTDRRGVMHEVSLGPGDVQERHIEELRDAAASALPPPHAEVLFKTAEPFVQAVFDIEVPRMAFGCVCLIGDAAFTLRPHAAAGTAKAAEDAWKLGGAVLETGGDVAAALERWEPGQLKLGRRILARTRDAGQRSQFEGTWRTGDPLPFGLYEVGDSSIP